VAPDDSLLDALQTILRAGADAAHIEGRGRITLERISREVT
jgi:hypothetical protein